MTHRVRVPLLSPNEDEATVTRVRVSVGDLVGEGDLLCEIETTKTSADVEAPVEGYVRDVVAPGQRRRIGETLVVITETADEPVEPEPEPAAGSGAPSAAITPRALELAERHGIDWRGIRSRGIVTERDVRALIEPEPEPAPALVAPALDGALPLVVFGAAGGGKVIAELVSHIPSLEVVGFLDPAVAPGTTVAGHPVLGGDELLAELAARGRHAGAIACGLINFDPRIRIRVFDLCRSLGVSLPALVHPTAFVDASARLGTGVQVHAMAVVGADAVLGDGVVVNSGAVVSHDCRIGAHTHVTPGALLAGGVEIGPRCLIGMGATVLNGVTVGADVVVNNGRDVLHDLESGSHVK